MNTINIFRLKISRPIVMILDKPNRSLQPTDILFFYWCKESQLLSVFDRSIQIAVIQPKSVALLLNSLLLWSETICENIHIFEYIFFVFFDRSQNVVIESTQIILIQNRLRPSPSSSSLFFLITRLTQELYFVFSKIKINLIHLYY